MTLVISHRPTTHQHGVPVLDDTVRIVRSASLALVVLSLGAYGYGKLPDARISTDVQNVVTIQHDRVGSIGQTQNISLHIVRPAGEAISISLDETFAGQYVLDRSEPTANTVTTVRGGSVLTFDTPRTADGFDIALTIKPLVWGRLDFTLRASVAQRVATQTNMTQFVTP
jgi:hypothetical protein